jgi:hypothetical protein
MCVYFVRDFACLAVKGFVKYATLGPKRGIPSNSILMHLKRPNMYMHISAQFLVMDFTLSYLFFTFIQLLMRPSSNEKINYYNSLLKLTQILF